MSGSLRILALTFVLFVVGCTPGGESATTTTESTTASSGPLVTTTATAISPDTTTAGAGCDTPMCLTYHIDPEASWADGTPVTATDFAHTAGLYIDSGHDPVYALISGVEVIDDKTLLVSLSQPVGAWRGLFSSVVPAHVAEYSEGLVTAGQFRVTAWYSGDRLVLSRTPGHWAAADLVTGLPVGDVDEVEVIFVPDVNERLTALRRGDLDLINSRPDEAMFARGIDPGLTARLSPGALWEHVGFNHDHPLLSYQWVREAIATAIDREAIRDATVRRIDPEALTLESALFPIQAEAYQDNYSTVFDPSSARGITEDHFCVRGADGIYNCGGQRMSFVWATTEGDGQRERVVAMAAETLREAGIEVIPLIVPSSEMFTEEFFSGNRWQIISFAWRMGDDPSTIGYIYTCGGGTGYCSPQLDEMLAGAANEPDDVARRSAYQVADRLILDEVVVIPLYQRPIAMLMSERLAGPRPNMSTTGDLWNLGAWIGQTSVVMAIGADPGSIDAINPSTDDMRMLTGILFPGAFGLTPELDYVPLLVDHVDVETGAAS